MILKTNILVRSIYSFNYTNIDSFYDKDSKELKSFKLEALTQVK